MRAFASFLALRCAAPPANNQSSEVGIDEWWWHPSSPVPSSADVSGRGTPVQARWLDPTTDVSTWLTSLVSNLTAASDGGRAPTIHEGHFNAPER